MKSIVSVIVGFLVMAFSLQCSFRVMNAMLVHDDANVMLSPDICPVQKDADGNCMIVGDLTHNLAGDAEIRLNNGSVLVISRERVLATSYRGDSSHYEPFGSAGAFIIGGMILVAGAAIGFGLPTMRFRRLSSKQ